MLPLSSTPQGTAVGVALFVACQLCGSWSAPVWNGLCLHSQRPDGTPVIYDINTNTNYNAAAEAQAGLEVGGMQRIAEFLTGELANQENALEAA